MFDSTDPTILALVAALNTKVADYKASAEAYVAKEDVSLGAMLALPVSSDGQLIIDYVEGNLSKVLDVDEHEDLAAKFNGNENVYAHIAKNLRDAADYFEKVAKNWAPSLCGQSKPVTFDEIQSKAAACDTLFRSIVDMCNETANTTDPKIVEAVTGQEVQTKKYDKTGTVSFLVNIPRFRSPRTDKKADNTGTLSININGVPVQETGPWDLNAACMRYFGFPAQDLLSQFKSAGIKFEEGSQLTVNGMQVQVTKVD